MNSEDINHLSKDRWIRVNDFLIKAGCSDSIAELNSKILKELPELVPFENSGVIIELDGNLRPAIKASVNSPEKWNSLFNEYYYRISTYPDIDKNIFFADYNELKKYQNSEYYNDFLTPQRIKCTAGFLIFDDENRLAYTITINRTKPEHMFSTEELSAMKAIQPHLSNYYRILSLNEKIKKLPVLLPELEKNNTLLSGRESEIANLLLQRHRPADIAKELGISILTVRKHIQNIYEKLNVTDRKQLLQRIYRDFSKNQ